MHDKTRKGGAKKGQVYKKRKPYEVVICPHCLTEGKGSVMQRWHFDRCASGAALIQEDIQEEEDEEVKD